MLSWPKLGGAGHSRPCLVSYGLDCIYAILAHSLQYQAYLDSVISMNFKLLKVNIKEIKVKLLSYAFKQQLMKEY